MCRIVNIALVLAVVAAASAYGAPVSSARTHRRAPAPHSAASSRIPHRSPNFAGSTKNAHRPTPKEVGRAAGMKIRRRMAQQSARFHRVPRQTKAEPSRIHLHRRTARPEPAHLQPPQLLLVSRTEALARVEETDARIAHRELPSIQFAQQQPVQPAPRIRPEQPVTTAAADIADADPPTLPEPSANQPPSGQSRPDQPWSTEPPSIEPASPPFETLRPIKSAANQAIERNQIDSAVTDAGQRRDAALAVQTQEASLHFSSGVMPAPLRGSLESLERQNQRLSAEGLERIEDEDDLAARIEHRLLIPVPASEALLVNGNLPANHRYCRPWTARFLADLAQAHEAAFHRPLLVSSAVRTVDYQKRLMLINGNAAPAVGDVVSPHLTGAAVDIAKDGLSRQEMAWMRRRLLILESSGKIDVEEEFQQACFHITVYSTYTPTRPPHRKAQARAGSSKTRPIKTESSAGIAAQGL